MKKMFIKIKRKGSQNLMRSSHPGIFVIKIHNYIKLVPGWQNLVNARDLGSLRSLTQGSRGFESCARIADRTAGEHPAPGEYVQNEVV